MAKVPFFYSKEQIKQLKEIKTLHRGKERMQILADWAATNNRKLPSVVSKVYNLKVSKDSKNLVVGHTSEINPRTGGIIRINIKSIVINNNEMIVSYY